MCSSDFDIGKRGRALWIDLLVLRFYHPANGGLLNALVGDEKPGEGCPCVRSLLSPSHIMLLGKYFARTMIAFCVSFSCEW
eukprot:5336769-Amphidinium_carterae.2